MDERLHKEYMEVFKAQSKTDKVLLKLCETLHEGINEVEKRLQNTIYFFGYLFVAQALITFCLVKGYL